MSIKIELLTLICTHSFECTLEYLLTAEQAGQFTNISAYNKVRFLRDNLIQNRFEGKCQIKLQGVFQARQKL